MAGVINLRRHRKRRARDEAASRAGANAALHGESGPGRRLRQARAGLEARRLEQHRLEDGRDDHRRGEDREE